MRHQKPPRQNFRRTKGSALITVTLIGLFIMLVAAALVNHITIAEANAIAHSLAKTRIYWASMGHINYSLSRLRREGLCGGACINDDVRAVNLHASLAELNNAGSPRPWEFDDNYSFKLSATVIDGPFPTSNDNDGRVRATISLEPVAGSNFDELNGIETRIRGKLVVDICLAAPCGAPNESSSGANRIEALRRQ